jgi:hypothetical protein
MNKQRLLARLAVGLLVLASCGDDSSNDEESSDTTSGADATTTTGAGSDTTTGGGSASIEASPLTVALDSPYGAGDPAVAAGAVTVSWYQADDNYVAVYSGEGIGELPALCPGNSLALPDRSYDFISNAPTAEGGCEGVDTTEVTEVVVCDAAWIFPTLIPSDGEGQLFASISSPGITAGVLGFVGAEPSVPEIDPSATSFTVGDDALGYGITELTC